MLQNSRSGHIRLRHIRPIQRKGGQHNWHLLTLFITVLIAVCLCNLKGNFRTHKTTERACKKAVGLVPYRFILYYLTIALRTQDSLLPRVTDVHEGVQRNKPISSGE